MVTNLQLYWNAKAFGSEDLITLIHQFEAIDNQLRLLALVSSYRNHSLKQLRLTSLYSPFLHRANTISDLG